MTAKISLLKKSLLLTILLFSLSENLFAKTKKDAGKSPENVVALSKSVAEMWILAGGQLAGATDDALELEEVKNAVSIGTTHTASFEAIIALNPDFVIMTQDIPSHKKLYSNLLSVGIKVYIADVKDFADYEKVLQDFTNYTGRKDLYQKNVLEVRKAIEKVISDFSKASGSQEKRSASYLFLRVSGTKNKVLKEHFGNEIFQNLGLKSIVDDDSGLDEIGIEAIVGTDPDYIFVVYQGNQKNAQDSFYKAYQSNPAWKGLSAVKNNRVQILPKELFNFKPNARWAEAYQVVVDLIK